MLPSGEQKIVSVPFASETGFSSYKESSFGFGKRNRNACDILLVISQLEDIKRAIIYLKKVAI